MSARRASWLVVCAAVVAHGASLSGGFVLDDLQVVVTNPLVQQPERALEAFGLHYLAHDPRTADPGMYRPLTVVSLAAGRALHGPAPAGFHAVNLLLHALAAWLVLRLSSRLLPDARTALLGALVFAVHPLATEAVANVAGRAELLAAVGALACLLGRERARTGRRPFAWTLASAGGFALALFSKESGAAVPLVLLGMEALAGRKFLVARRPAAVLLAALVVAIGSAWAVLRADATEPPREALGMLGLPAGARVGTALWILLRYLALFVAPVHLSAWWTESSSELDLRGVAAALALAALGVAAWRARRAAPAVGLGLAFAALAILPASNLLVPIGVIGAERLLYLPLAGLALAAAGALHPLLRRLPSPRTASVVAGLVLAALAGRTLRRTLDWRDDGTLARATLARAPGAALFHERLAAFALAGGDLATARAHAERALALEPDADRHALSGAVAQAAGDAGAAAAHYRRAVAEDPAFLEARNNLGLALLDAGRGEEALEVLRETRARFPDEPAVLGNLILVHAARGEWDEALPYAREAASRFGREARLLWSAGVVHREAGLAREAEALFARARSLDPGVGLP